MKQTTHRAGNTQTVAVGIEAVPPHERVLLLPHCLRISGKCRAASCEDGLACVGCSEECPVNILRSHALGLGYKGVCVAPGGSLALRYVKDRRPSGIVAVACDKELREGVEGVKDLAADHGIDLPAIVIIPLTREGCVDTEVDIDAALATLELGCPPSEARAAAL